MRVIDSLASTARGEPNTWRGALCILALFFGVLAAMFLAMAGIAMICLLMVVIIAFIMDHQEVAYWTCLAVGVSAAAMSITIGMINSTPKESHEDHEDPDPNTPEDH